MIRYFLVLAMPMVAVIAIFRASEGVFFGPHAIVALIVMIGLVVAIALRLRKLPVALNEDGSILIVQQGRPWQRLPLSSLAGYRLRPGEAPLLDIFTRNGNTFTVRLHSDRNLDRTRLLLAIHTDLHAMEHAPSPERLILWPEGPPEMAIASQE